MNKYNGVRATMADDEDDYLSDKFLQDASSTSAPQTYQQKRKEAERRARLKNEQNRLKSRRQQELESREEGLSKSLFERAKEEQDAGVGTGNKALSIMMRMGFKPGQSLGKVDDEPNAEPATPDRELSAPGGRVGGASSRAQSAEPKPQVHHKTEPLPLNEWAGKKGIGLGKRARSPTSADRVAKMAKMAEEASQHTFRDRAREEYLERQADGRLGPAQRTCTALDEKAGKSFNVLWLSPNDTDSFPEGLMDVLSGQHFQPLLSTLQSQRNHEHVEVRLRRQMQEDALLPLSELDQESALSKQSTAPVEKYSADTISEAIQFLRLNARDRLQLVLAYLREKYAYCFWCGTQYDGLSEMDSQCPGPDEDAHD